eukprot:3903733-Prymnesium_polylepis.1
MPGGRLDLPSTPPRTGCPGPVQTFTPRVRAAHAAPSRESASHVGNYAQGDHAEHQEVRLRAGAARWSRAKHCRRARARPTCCLSSPALLLSGDRWTGHSQHLVS